MALLDYPVGLPGPSQSTHTLLSRVFASDVTGPLSAARAEFAHKGLIDVELFLTSAQAAVFYDFWKNDLFEGGNWFNAAWPTLWASGLMVVQIMGQPRFIHVYDGAYRVTFQVQVRDVFSEPVELGDAFFGNVRLLVHGNGNDGDNLIIDSSSYALTPVVTGTIITQEASDFFASSGVRCFSNAASTAEFTDSTPFASATDAFTLEITYRIVTQTLIGDGYAEPRGEFFRLENTGNSIKLSLNGLINSAATHTVTAPGALGINWASYGLATGFDRVSVAFVRAAGGAGGWIYYAGKYAGLMGWNSDVNLINIGNKNLTSRTTGALLEEIRFTQGVERYPFMGYNVGDIAYIPSLKPFPNR